MTDRKRDPLPKGYQFGDAAPFDPMRPFDLSRRTCANGLHFRIGNSDTCVCGKTGWNVIEHEEH